MHRRTFAKALTAASLLSSTSFDSAESPSLIRPRVLKPGDTVGLITPSTYVSDPDTLATADRTVKYFGLKARWGKNVRKREGYLGGSVDQRVEDLHAMFADPDVNAVFALRGGYGSAQPLDHIDYKLVRAHPKIFVGYSNIT